MLVLPDFGGALRCGQLDRDGALGVGAADEDGFGAEEVGSRDGADAVLEAPGTGATAGQQEGVLSLWTQVRDELLIQTPIQLHTLTVPI